MAPRPPSSGADRVKVELKNLKEVKSKYDEQKRKHERDEREFGCANWPPANPGGAKRAWSDNVRETTPATVASLG